LGLREGTDLDYYQRRGYQSLTPARPGSPGHRAKPVLDIFGNQRRRAPRGRASCTGWFNIAPETAVEVVRRACALFPSRGIVEHDTLMRQLADVGYGRAWA
jgi:hypothetical protein